MIEQTEVMERLLSTYEMMGTVMEALGAWQEDPGQAFLREDILAGVSCAAQATENLLSTKAQKRLKMGKEHLAKQSSAAKFQETLSALYVHFQNDCAAAMFHALEDVQELPRELGARVLAFCDSLQNEKSVSTCAVTWGAAVKTAACLPRESYEHALKALENNPQLLKTLGIKTPGYEPHATNYTERCLACGGKGEPYYTAHQNLAINYEPFFQPAKLWMKCSACGSLFAYNFPELTQEDFVGCDTSDKESDIRPRFQLSLFSDVLLAIQTFTQGRRLLEVGVGNGELMAVATEMGYTVEGVEIALKEAEKIRNQLQLTVHCGDFLEYKSGNEYDVISMGDVIEHMTQPIEAVKKAYELLAPGGVLLLSTPNYESAFSRFFQFQDPMWKEPWHMSYFSFDSLRPFLQEIGFSVLQYRVSSHYNGSMELILGKGVQ